MTAAKIAITLPEEQLARVRAAVKSGRADSVSAYIAHALASEEREQSLRVIVAELIAQHGEPSAKEKAWAAKVLARRRGA